MWDLQTLEHLNRQLEEKLKVKEDEESRREPTKVEKAEVKEAA